MDAMVRGNLRRQSSGVWCDYGKRVQDVLLAAAGLMLLWPLFLLTCLIIVLDSPGASPVFVQTRVGKDGKHFRMYKFRTMCPDAERLLPQLMPRNEMDGPCFKIREDPRITRFGRLLRRTGMDELPQLWNVLRGDMSIVGPRPPVPREVEAYGPYEWQRLMVKPGITCYWQIQPDRNTLTFNQWMELDVQYLQDKSFATDWKILFATVKAVLRMDGQ